MITQKISVPLDANPPYERVKMHYCDSGRVLEVTMLFDGLQFAPSGSVSATFNAKKPDGTIITRTDGVVITGSTVTIDITTNTLAQVGMVYCECIIVSGTDSVGTMRFEIEVMEPAILNGDIESTDDYQSVIAAASSAQAFAESASLSADSAEQSANLAQNIDLHPVIVGTNGNLWNWDSTTGAYADSGITASIGEPGPQGIPGKDGVSIIIQDGEYREPGSIKDLPDLPAFSDTAEGNAYLVDDDAIEGQYDLYIHGVGGTDWTIVDNWGGVPGHDGAPGADGVIQSLIQAPGISITNPSSASPIIANSAPGFSTFNHSKSGTLHILTFATGINSTVSTVKFKATASYNDGDAFRVSGTNMTTINGTPSFVTGETVMAFVDGSTINFKSGGGGFNLRVFGGSSRPASPKEGDIWMQGAVVVGKPWYGVNPPASPAQGQVWVPCASESNKSVQVAANALVPVSSPQRYNNGAWAGQHSEIYAGGAWASFELLIYGDGVYDVRMHLVSESGNGTASISSQNNQLKIESAYNGGGTRKNSVYGLNTLVDLSDFEAVTIDYLAGQGQGDSGAIVNFVRVTNSNGTTIYIDHSFGVGNVVSWGAGTLTLDISQLTGMGDLRIGVAGGAYVNPGRFIATRIALS